MTSTTTCILGAHWRSARNGLHDRRLVVVWIVALAVGLAASFFVATALRQRLLVWEAAGADVVHEQMWLLLMRTATAFGALSVLTTARDGLGSNETHMLLTLPIEAASRFRALCIVILIDHARPLSALFLLMVAGEIGFPVMPWLILELGLIGVATLGGIIGLCSIVRYGIARGKAVRRLALLGGAAVASVAIGVLGGGFDLPLESFPNPGIAAAMTFVVIGLVLGPGAARFGRLYTEAVHTMIARTGKRRVMTPPGLRLLGASLARRRDVAGALLTKEILTQSRNPLNWVRLVVMLFWLLPFAYLHKRLQVYDIPDTLLATSYVAALVLFIVVDAAPSPIGSEADRLQLFFIAPVDLGHILRAKLLAFLVPAVGLGTVFSLALGLWLRLSSAGIAFAAASSCLIIAATTALLVWGSAWDEDLHLAVEGPAPTFIHEQLPATPRRLGVITLCMLLLAVSILIIWQLPAATALVALTGLGAIVMIIAYRFGHWYLQSLVRRA